MSLDLLPAFVCRVELRIPKPSIDEGSSDAEFLCDVRDAPSQSEQDDGALLSLLEWLLQSGRFFHGSPTGPRMWLIHLSCPIKNTDQGRRIALPDSDALRVVLPMSDRIDADELLRECCARRAKMASEVGHELPFVGAPHRPRGYVMHRFRTAAEAKSFTRHRSEPSAHRTSKEHRYRARPSDGRSRKP